MKLRHAEADFTVICPKRSGLVRAHQGSSDARHRNDMERAVSWLLRSEAIRRVLFRSRFHELLDFCGSRYAFNLLLELGLFTRKNRPQCFK